MKTNHDLLYKKIKKNFYHDQTVSKNPLRKWFHLNRYRIASCLVKSVYKNGTKIIDLGCGSCDWNVDCLSVFGVDINEDLLKLGKEKNRLAGYKVADASTTGLPAGSFDIVTAFEFLEHKEEYSQIIEESKRLLKDGGRCIVSVPFDVFFSLWRPLFFVQTLFQGYILQNAYYKKKCGHINHFSIETIKAAFLKHGFNVELVFTMRKLTIFLCAQKNPEALLPAESYNDTTIILPTLNEGGNIAGIIASLITHYKDCHIIVSDDGSCDNTKESALRFEHKNLVFLDRGNQEIHGLTASVVDAIRLVKTKYFVVMDADGQHPPKKIKEIVNILRLNGNLVIASRIEVEKEWGLIRKLLSYIGTILSKTTLLLRGKFYLSFDVLGGFFGCNTSFWNKCSSERFKRKHFRLRGYKVLFDFLKYAPSRLRIDEVYYKFETRKSEASKINLRVYLDFLKSVFLR